MSMKKIITVEKGRTRCEECPFFGSWNDICHRPHAIDIDCNKFDLSTLKVEVYEKPKKS